MIHRLPKMLRPRRTNRTTCFVCHGEKIYVIKMDFFKSSEADQKFLLESTRRMHLRLVDHLFGDVKEKIDAFTMRSDRIKSGAPISRRHYALFCLTEDLALPLLLVDSLWAVTDESKPVNRYEAQILARAKDIPELLPLRFVV